MLRVAVRGLTLLLCSLTLWIAPGAAQPNPSSNSKGRSSAHVYLFTGLFGITSGLDGVAAKIKNQGLPTTMSSPGASESIAQSAIDEYRSGRLRSIVLIGYSTGGRSVLEMAAHLAAAKVPVQLAVIIDGSSGPPVAPNVRRLVNFYVFDGYGAPITRPTNFRGSLENIAVKDSKVGHFSIIDAKERQLLSLVLSAARSGPAASPPSPNP